MGCGAIDYMNKNNKENKSNIKQLYIDDSFPPSNISIFGKENLEKIEKGKKIHNNKYYKKLLKYYKQNQIIWKRAKEIFNNEEYSLFSENISPKNVIQGSIGNCYFLSVIAGLTKFPSIIYHLFNSINRSENGFYTIYLKINNKISKIYLDDYFPYNIRKNKPLFCKPYKNEIWVMLLEKAWAKIKGSYLDMDNGSPIDVLNSFLLSENLKEDLVYKFYSLGNINEKDKIWSILINTNEDNSFKICLSKKNLENKKKLNKLNYSIVEEHFYNIIEVYEKDEKKLLKIRNPWGFNLKNKNYNKSKNETDFIIDDNEENFKQNEEDLFLEDGEFIIDFNYFCYLFEEIQIYEIKRFSTYFFYNLNEQVNEINIIYLGIKEIKSQECILKLKLFMNEKINNFENEYINFHMILVGKEDMKIYDKKNYKIYLNRLESQFSLLLESKMCFNYYLCFYFSSNINGLNDIDINIFFRNQKYMEIINYNQYYEDQNLLDIIKIEFKDSNINFSSLKYKKNIFN